MSKGHRDHEGGMPRSSSMLDLESGGILSDDAEFRGFSHSSSKNHIKGSKRKLDRLRSGSLNIYGNIDKDKSQNGNGSSMRPPPKPPRPPRGPALDEADMKLIREISEISKVKHARIERLRSIKSKRAVDNKPQSSRSTSIVAMVVTVVFFIIIVFQGMHSR